MGDRWPAASTRSLFVRPITNRSTTSTHRGGLGRSAQEPHDQRLPYKGDAGYVNAMLAGGNPGGNPTEPIVIGDVGWLYAPQHGPVAAIAGPRGSSEAPPGGLVEQAADEYRAWIRALFRDLAVDAGAFDPDTLAAQLQLIYDGAGLSARMDRRPDVATPARAAVNALLDAKPPSTP